MSNPGQIHGSQDIYTVEGLKRILRTLNYSPSKQLGQHFLLDLEILEFIVASAGIRETDRVIEIGPGFGQLTRLLAETGAPITAIEIDRVLHAYARNYFLNRNQVTILLDDGVRFLRNLSQSSEAASGSLKLVANLPYQITSPVLFAAMDLASALPELVLTIQREVADRLVAPPGSSERCVVSVLLELHHRVEILADVAATAFWPRPMVDSTVIQIRWIPQPRWEVADLPGFRLMVRHCFQQKRKMMRNSIVGQAPLPTSSSEAASILSSVGIQPSDRPERVTVDQFVALWHAIRSHNGIVD